VGASEVTFRIVNEAAARRYWPQQSPLWRRLQIDGGPPWRTVVGVVGDVRHEALNHEARPELYLPFTQLPYSSTTMSLAVGTTGEPQAAAEAVKAALAAVDPGIALTRVLSMDDVVGASVADARFRAILIGAFAVLALALASLGV
jgi:putative ABC transport system permease protein